METRDVKLISISFLFQSLMVPTNRISLAGRRMSLTTHGYPQIFMVSFPAFQSLTNLVLRQLPNKAHKSIPFLSLTALSLRFPLRLKRVNRGQILGSQKIILWLKECFPALLAAGRSHHQKQSVKKCVVKINGSHWNSKGFVYQWGIPFKDDLESVYILNICKLRKYLWKIYRNRRSWSRSLRWQIR